MTRITIDSALLTQLQDLTHPAEICDPSGHVLGQFVPKIDPSDWEALTPEASEEELRRREQETESYSTAEVLAYLERLSCSESDGSDPP